MLATLGDLVEDVIVRLGGPINVASDTPATIGRRRGGSAANTAAVAARRGLPARFLGQVGDDAIGTALLAELAADGVDVTHVRRGGDTGTIVALVDHRGERTMLTDRRACTALEHPDPAWLDGIDVLHVPLYSLAVEPVAATATAVIGWANRRGVAVSIDVSSTAVMSDMGIKTVWSLLERLQPGIVLANRDEAALLEIDGPVAGAITIVKRGADAAAAYVPGCDVLEVPAIGVDGVDDTTGAGDAFTAGLLGHTGWRSAADGAGLSGLAGLAAAVEAGHRAAADLLTTRHLKTRNLP